MNEMQHDGRVSHVEIASTRKKFSAATSPAGGGAQSWVAEERRAVRFFWTVLMLSSSASVAGNVTHAVWNAAGPALVVAAVAALVPPLALLGATHSVGVLARVRTNSFAFWASMLIAIAVVVCAFWLSFNALRWVAVDLANVDRGIAWMMPVCIDLSIAGATLALLSLSRSTATGDAVSQAARPAAVSVRGSTPPQQRDRAPAAATTNGRADSSASGLREADTRPQAVPGPNSGHGRPAGARQERPALVAVGQMAHSGASAELHPDAEARWSAVAETLVLQKRTKIPAKVVAKVLALRAEQTPPSTIGRLLKVHHSAVRNILDGADELDGSGSRAVPGMA
jgi:hypothetical protein